MDEDVLFGVRSTLSGEGDSLSKLLNSLALVKDNLGEGSWVGVYVYDEKKGILNLGPFQGSPACVQIKPGKGVVGTCYATKHPLYVSDIKKFPNYICCDPIVKSEAVFPLFSNKQVIAVFDVDSPKINGLKSEIEILSQVAEMIARFI